MIKRIWKKILLNKKNNEKIETNSIKKVLFMTMTYGLGDGIRNTGTIESLSEKYNLDFLGNSNQQTINRYNDKINKIYIYKCKKNKKIIKSIILNIRLIVELRKNRYDLIIDGHSSSKTFNLIFLRLLNSKMRFGMKNVNNKYNFPESDISLYDNLFYNYDEILNFLKIEKKEDIIRLPEGLDKKYPNISPRIIFNTEGSTRKIDIEKLKEILISLNEFNQDIWIISTESRRNEIEELLSKEKYEHIKLLPLVNFYEAIEFIRRSELLISPNTSFIHVAGLYNKKIIGIYSNLKWHTELWRPVVDEYELIIPTKETKETDDLGEIDVEKIREAFVRLLKLEE